MPPEPQSVIKKATFNGGIEEANLENIDGQIKQGKNREFEAYFQMAIFPKAAYHLSLVYENALCEFHSRWFIIKGFDGPIPISMMPFKLKLVLVLRRCWESQNLGPKTF